MVIAERGFLPDDSYRFLGQTHTVRSNSAEILDHVRWVYRRFHLPTSAPTAHRPGQVADATGILEVVDRSECGELFVQDCLGSYVVPCRDLYAPFADRDHSVNSYFSCPLAHVDGSLLRNIAALAPGYDLIHAGAVSSEGRAVMFPGLSGRGKTTLSLMLLRRGFKLLSDEIACLRRDSGIVDPFPRLIKFDEQSRRLLDIPAGSGTKAPSRGNGETEWRLDVEDLVPSGLGGPASLRYVILLDGFAERTRLEPLSQLRALFELARHSVRQSENASAALFELTPFLKDVRCFSLLIGDLDEAVELIQGLVDDAGDVSK